MGYIFIHFSVIFKLLSFLDEDLKVLKFTTLETVLLRILLYTQKGLKTHFKEIMHVWETSSQMWKRGAAGSLTTISTALHRALTHLSSSSSNTFPLNYTLKGLSESDSAIIRKREKKSVSCTSDFLVFLPNIFICGASKYLKSIFKHEPEALPHPFSSSCCTHKWAGLRFVRKVKDELFYFWILINSSLTRLLVKPASTANTSWTSSV